MKQRVKARFVLAGLAVVAALVLVASFGRPLPVFPFSPVPLDQPSVAATDGETTVVAINEAHRLAVINKDNRLAALIDLETFEAPIEFASHVCISDGRIFVSGVRRSPDSDVIEKERIVSYDLSGNDQRIVYEREGSGIDPTIMSLDDTEAGALFITRTTGVSEDKPGSLEVRRTADKGAEPLASVDASTDFLISASCSINAEYISSLSYRGVINDSGDDIQNSKHIFCAISADDDGSIFACDGRSGGIFRVAPDGTLTTITSSGMYSHIRVLGSVLCAVSRDDNVVRTLGTDGVELESYRSVEPTAAVSAQLVLVWASALYLVALVLVLTVRAAVRLVAQERYGDLAASVASVAIVATVGIALGVTSANAFNAQIATRTNEIDAYAAYLDSLAPQLAQTLKPCRNRELFLSDTGQQLSTEEYSTLANSILQVANLARSAADNNIGLYTALYGKDGDGVFCVVDSLGEYVWGESLSSTPSLARIERTFREQQSQDKAAKGQSRYEDTLFRTVYLPATDGSGDGLVIEVGSRMQSFSSGLVSNLFRNALALLVLLLVVYMGYAELRACGRCVMRYGRMRNNSEAGAISALARPFALTSMMLASIDGVMSTLIAKELLSAAGYDSGTPLVTVPAIMLGVGQALGQGVYGQLGARVPLRRLLTWGSAAMVGCAVFAGASVVSSNFWAYCAAKLLLAIPFGLLYTAAYSLRRHAVTKEQQELAKAGVKRSNTSSAALGTALGGYAAQLLGNAWVYAIVALVSVALIMLAVYLIPAGTLPPEDDRDFSPEERRRMYRFIASPRALAIAVCIILPSVIATGYTSTLFPLFSSEMGFNKADINNMYLLGQLIVYVSIGGIERLSKRLGNWRAGLYAIAGLGVVFSAFSLNTTVVWGVVIIVLVGLLVKAANAWKPLWIEAADDASVPLGWATGAMFIVRSFSRIAKPFILGGLIVVGQPAVPIIGAFCLVCAVLFYFVTRRYA